MKKLISATALLIALAFTASAQKKVIAEGVQGGNGGPSGPCTVGTRVIGQRPGTDIFIDWSGPTLYVCKSGDGNPTSSGTWQKVKADATGVGMTIINGPDVPGDEGGKDGDFYFALDTGNVYQKDNGTWGDPITRHAIVDTNGNVAANNFFPSYNATASSAGTLTLTVASARYQEITGSTTHTVQLPVVATLPKRGVPFEVVNSSSGVVTVNSSGGNAVQVLAAGTSGVFTCKLLTGTGAASWNVTYVTPGISNSAPVNSLIKTLDANGNLTFSTFYEDVNTLSFGNTSSLSFILDNSFRSAVFGDQFSLGNGTRWELFDFAGTIDFYGVNNLTLHTALFGAGSTGTEFQTNGSGVTTNYNGIPTAGKGLSAIYNSVSLTSQSSSIGTTNIQVNSGVAPAGLYRLTYYLFTTTAGTSGTVSATFGWSDPAAARTSGTGNITFGTLAAPASGSVIIKANGAANITYLTTVTAAVGSPVYALNITLERLQ